MPGPDARVLTADGLAPLFAAVDEQVQMTLTGGPNAAAVLPARAVGGKAIRARLALAAAISAADHSHKLLDERSAVTAAAAVELLHLASLVHDDVMDDAPTRRGVPSVQAAHGVATAVALGDLIVAHSASLASSLGADGAKQWATGWRELCEGQLLEPILRHGNAASQLNYAELKTGALMGLACGLGALSQGGHEETVEAWWSAGREFGTAFQLADDLLDHIGDPMSLGKPIGTDPPRGIYSLGIWHRATLSGHRPADLSPEALEEFAVSPESISRLSSLIDSRLTEAGTIIRRAGMVSQSFEHLRSAVPCMVDANLNDRHRAPWLAARGQ